jgi:dihydroorotase
MDVVQSASFDLVLPGMIDTHVHVYRHVSGRFGLGADMVGVHSGVTTLVDQGGRRCWPSPAFANTSSSPLRAECSPPSRPTW